MLKNRFKHMLNFTLINISNKVVEIAFFTYVCIFISSYLNFKLNQL